MKLYKDKPTTCQIGPVRASYAHIFKPRRDKKDDGSAGDLKYSVTLLIPKQKHAYLEDPNEEITAIKGLIKAAAIQGFGSEPPKGLKMPLKDGDFVGPDEDEAKYPGYWFIKASTNAEWPDGEPKSLVVVDGLGNYITGGFGSGDWGKFKVTFKAFNKSVNKGVTCYLEGVQWLYKDEPLGESSGTDASEFDKVEGAHAAAAVAAGPATTTAGEYDPFADE